MSVLVTDIELTALKNHYWERYVTSGIEADHLTYKALMELIIVRNNQNTRDKIKEENEVIAWR